MEIDERKKNITSILTESFVEEYEAYKKALNYLNKDFRKSKIGFQYSYDQFCTDFLRQSLDSIEAHDIFVVTDYRQFKLNLWQFNMFNIECMLKKKIEELGYDAKEYYKKL